MEAVRLRVRALVRARWRSIALVALLAGVAAGAVLALAAGARRTASAPDRFSDSVGGDPAVVLFHVSGPPLTQAIADLSGVRQVQSITFIAAFPESLATRADGALVNFSTFIGDVATGGGRALEGRLADPAAPDELAIDRTAAEFFDVDVGDRLDMVTYSQEQADQNFEADPGGPRFAATVVGIVEYPSDLDDPLIALAYSPAVLDAHPDIAQTGTFATVRGAPDASAAAILAEIRGLPGGASVIEQESQVVSSGARRAVRLHVVALWVVTGVAAVVAVLIAGQLAARQARAATVEGETLRALGYGPRQVMAESAIESGALGAGAALVAIAVAIAASSLFPIGVLRSVEPDPGWHVDVLVMLVGAAGLIVTFVVAGVLSAVRATRPDRATARPRPGLPDLVASTGAGPSMVTGVRFAFTSPGRGRAQPLAVALSVIIGITGLVGALVVGTSLVRMLDEPALWGADYDQSFGNPEMVATEDLVTPVAADPDVAGLTAATSGRLTLDGSDVPIIAYEPIRGGILPVVLDGRTPSAPDEIALGRLVAQRLDLRSVTPSPRSARTARSTSCVSSATP